MDQESFPPPDFTLLGFSALVYGILSKLLSRTKGKNGPMYLCLGKLY
jgi:hypothetical protein